MDGFPQQLAVVLIFVAFVLAQLLLKHLRKRAPKAGAEAQPSDEAPDDGYGAAVARRVTLDEEPADAAPPPARPVPAPPRAVAAPLPRDARRFSRRALMGSRREVQDAIVVAAILGPCRAYRPHSLD